MVIHFFSQRVSHYLNLFVCFKQEIVLYLKREFMLFYFYLMNNTSQIIGIGQATRYTSPGSYDDFALALGVDIGLAVVGLIGVGVISYWWYIAPGDLPNTEIIQMNDLENCCFDFVLEFFNLNIAYQLLIIYILFIFMIFISYKRSMVTK